MYIIYIPCPAPRCPYLCVMSAFVMHPMGAVRPPFCPMPPFCVASISLCLDYCVRHAACTSPTKINQPPHPHPPTHRHERRAGVEAAARGAAQAGAVRREGVLQRLVRMWTALINDMCALLFYVCDRYVEVLAPPSRAQHQHPQFTQNTHTHTNQKHQK